ncbi:CbrC family protein [Micromonospora sp. 4G57]|uniref:CbrC family protein n=1 Tax=Micromonospora sicca TaxID=2202420 RepID=A0ABU5JPB7_9ACTN|nr:CbrC family protein [Micromonospora sp. 4G53]MDZ5447654.1 CbrC family protein [Micromonospora sp. 4G57]MDZ5494386.1 CbrC family protein [Micromonospora sp. 4G53]
MRIGEHLPWVHVQQISTHWLLHRGRRPRRLRGLEDRLLAQRSPDGPGLTELIRVTQPRFRYHPDPVATGSAVPTVEACDLCGVPRGWRYAGPIYGRQIDVLCLHCIASSEAAQALTGAADWPCMFTDTTDVPQDVPFAVVEEITQRTPGFDSWQQPSWLYHCGDGAAFLGAAGHEDLRAHPDALEMIRDDLHRLGWPADQADAMLRRMDRSGEPTAYLFLCLHCGVHLASWDIG